MPSATAAEALTAEESAPAPLSEEPSRGCGEGGGGDGGGGDGLGGRGGDGGALGAGAGASAAAPAGAGAGAAAADASSAEMAAEGPGAPESISFLLFDSSAMTFAMAGVIGMSLVAPVRRRSSG